MPQLAHEPPREPLQLPPERCPAEARVQVKSRKPPVPGPGDHLLPHLPAPGAQALERRRRLSPPSPSHARRWSEPSGSPSSRSESTKRSKPTDITPSGPQGPPR